MQHILEEIGIAARLVLATDSSSTRLLVLKRGPGRMRHLEARQLWLQEELRAGRIIVTTAASDQKVADVFTKPIAKAKLHELGVLMGLRWPQEKPNA